MRITRNVTPGSCCALCGKELERGTLGANFMPSMAMVRRAHVACLKKWQTEVIPALRRAAT